MGYTIQHTKTMLFSTTDRFKFERLMLDTQSTHEEISELWFERDGSTNFDAFRDRCEEWYTTHSTHKVLRKLIPTEEQKTLDTIPHVHNARGGFFDIMVKAGASDFALKRISFNRNRLFRSHTDGSNQKSYAIHRTGTVLYDSNGEFKL